MKRRIVIGLACLVSWSAPGAVQTNGPASSFSVTTNAVGNRSFLFQLAPTGQVEVTPFAPDVVRVRFHFGVLYPREEPAIARAFTNWPAFAAGVTNTPTNLVLTTSQLRVDIALSNRFRVVFRDPSGAVLLGDAEMQYDADYSQLADTNAYAQVAWPEGSTGVSNRPAGFKLRAVKPMPADQAYFGLGDFAGPLNRRGRVIQGWAQDAFAFSEFRNPKYVTLPFFYGVGPASAYGLFFHNPARPVFDFSGTTNYTFEAGDDQLDYFFFGGGSNHTMAAVLDRYSELTGRPQLLPKWAYGYHQSRHSYDSQDQVQQVATAARTHGFPCDAIYLDIDAQNSPGGSRQQLTFNAGFSNVPGMVSFCTNLGIRLVPIVEPCLLTNDPMYAEASSNLYFIKANNLANYTGTNFLGRVSWLDFSITNTAAWWRGKVGDFLTNGFDAIWNDLNEPNENAMPLDAVWYLDGRYGGGLVTNDTRKWHAVNKNTYCLLESRVSFDTLRQRSPALRPFVLSRSAWPGIAPYAAGWSGDNLSSFDAMRSNIRLGTSVMISGQPNFGHDIGGFVNDCGADLLARWIQWGVLTPFCRNHTLNGTADQEPWVHGGAHTLWNRRWIRFRYELMPYLYSLFRACSTEGPPANAPVVFHFAADTNTWTQNDHDFMAGSHLLAAPVFVSNATTRAVYLPGGAAWYDWYGDEKIAGGQAVTRPASLGALPLFVRDGAIIPMGPVQNHANEFQPAWLDIHVWPGTNSFTLYEDDGETTNHQAGVFAETPVSVVGSAANLAVSFGERSGTYPTGPRAYYVVAHAMENVTHVLLDSSPLPRFANRGELAANGWSYDTVSRRLTVRVADAQAAMQLAVATGGATATNPVFASSFSNLAVAGTFTLWNEAARNMRLVTNFVWAAVLDLTGPTNLEFKFVADDQWTFTNWGDSAQGDFTPPLAQTAEPNTPSNVFLSGSYTGLFTFTFNETSLAYSVASAETSDSDGDGATDAWESYHGLNPLGRGDALLDPDGDGVNNLAEFIAGTVPVSSSSYFVVASEAFATNGVTVSWNAVSGRTYAVFATTHLPDGAAWQVVEPFTNVAGHGAVSVTDTNAVSPRHYRVRVSQ